MDYRQFAADTAANTLRGTSCTKAKAQNCRTLLLRGTYSGPLMGNINPPFPWTRMRFIRGTIKEPFFQFLGYKRTWLDVLVCSLVVQ